MSEAMEWIKDEIKIRRYRKAIRKCQKVVDLVNGGSSPVDVEPYWKDAFLYICRKLFGSDKKTAEFLWNDLGKRQGVPGQLAEPLFKSAFPRNDSRYWGGQFAITLNYCSDRWSRGRLHEVMWLWRKWSREI